MNYHVLEDDNFHYMDEDERIDLGVFDTVEEAINRAKKSVDDFLRENFRPGMTPEDLYRGYVDFGPDPFIISDDSSCQFSAWDYAKVRCPKICKETMNRSAN
jgi:hypothetical protein